MKTTEKIAREIAVEIYKGDWASSDDMQRIITAILDRELAQRPDSRLREAVGVFLEWVDSWKGTGWFCSEAMEVATRSLRELAEPTPPPAEPTEGKTL